MKRIIFLPVILFWLSLSILSQDLVITGGSLIGQFLQEPYETCLIILNDGRFFILTSYLEDKITLISLSAIAEKGKFSWENALLVIHSHFGVPAFSQADLNIWKALKRLGFQGYFGIYVQASNQIILLNKDGKKTKFFLLSRTNYSGTFLSSQLSFQTYY